MIKGFTPRGGKLQRRAPGQTAEAPAGMVIGPRAAEPVSPKPPETPLASTQSEQNDFGESPTLDTSALVDTPPKKRRFHLTKKQLIITGSVVGVLLLAAAGWWDWNLHHHKYGSVVATNKSHKKAAPKITTVASNLTGLQVDPSINQRPVTVVMIENSPDARPQSSLDQAGVVFEAVAEGGITRFLALFQDTQPDYIGPVRSVRPYYLQWLQGFDASVAHVGGSPEALNDIKSWGIKDLDQFANGNSYTRISSRFAPHNVYTSMGDLNAIESRKGYGASKYTSFVRKADAPSKAPTARAIDLTISSHDYNSHFDYDATTNSYKRSQAGAAHTQQAKDGSATQIAPKVVIALAMTKGIAPDDLHTAYTTIGNGSMYIFQDGIVQQGTWSKASGSAQFIFTDAQDKPLAINAGQTWITILDKLSAAASSP